MLIFPFLKPYHNNYLLIEQVERKQEALFLLCKAHFVLEDFQSCVEYCKQAGMEDIYMDTQLKRKTKLVAEGFAHKGNIQQLILQTDKSYLHGIVFHAPIGTNDLV